MPTLAQHIQASLVQDAFPRCPGTGKILLGRNSVPASLTQHAPYRVASRPEG